MDGSVGWLAEQLAGDDIRQLNEVTVAISPSRTLGLADAVRAWWEHVSKLEHDVLLPRDDPSIWGAHDFIAALVIRDVVAAGIARLSMDLKNKLQPAVASTDQRFLDYTEADSDGCIEKIDGRPNSHRGWWWQRAPKTGPIQDEIRLNYGHRAQARDHRPE